MGSTDFFFRPGTLSTILDAQAGSSGKAKVGSYVTENADNWSFACNTFMPQAGHWTVLRDGRKFFYQTLNSCAYNTHKYEKMYIGPGGMLELKALFREIEENSVPSHKLGISPITPILEDFDAAFERGEIGFDNTALEGYSDGTMKTGSTAHGCGSAQARRILRRPSLRLAKDVPELKEFICDVPNEILRRLGRGEAGLLEIAQGFQLSLLHQDFFPFVTSRNCGVSQGLSDMFLPPSVAGNVLLNFRTYPIRINSNKYIGVDGKHLTHKDIEAGVPHEIYEGNSGHWYPDQTELTWEEVTKLSGSQTPIREYTSVTKLSRRVATFSKQNLDEAVQFNAANGEVYLSVNFMNYVDATIVGSDTLNDKCIAWLKENLGEHYKQLRFVGTGANTEDMNNVNM